ncbi:hypothetical protein B0T26DRAFT_802810 [Lasiosphaeria miniovina]|uniref:Uncharacterized protein n=1 Tax=Lasiosphaeria miniovina TaxID=1954250 RepID=A0AA40AL54_9PEZI|nr:uncharacterized protein B0T26DRAFT_802810 [Lasiosphaeria miniovina]KAK0717780.1 hypothetical protein B0T26DRAFT_802810 [Lasiosphaeria miniovina]
MAGAMGRVLCCFCIRSLGERPDSCRGYAPASGKLPSRDGLLHRGDKKPGTATKRLFSTHPDSSASSLGARDWRLQFQHRLSLFSAATNWDEHTEDTEDMDRSFMTWSKPLPYLRHSPSSTPKIPVPYQALPTQQQPKTHCSCTSSSRHLPTDIALLKARERTSRST